MTEAPGTARSGRSHSAAAPAAAEDEDDSCWSLPAVGARAAQRVRDARRQVHRALDEAIGAGGSAQGTMDGRPAVRAYLWLLRELTALRAEALDDCGVAGPAWRRRAGSLLPAVEAAEEEMNALEGLLRRDAPSLALPPRTGWRSPQPHEGAGRPSPLWTRSDVRLAPLARRGGTASLPGGPGHLGPLPCSQRSRPRQWRSCRPAWPLGCP